MADERRGRGLDESQLTAAIALCEALAAELQQPSAHSEHHPAAQGAFQEQGPFGSQHRPGSDPYAGGGHGLPAGAVVLVPDIDGILTAAAELYFNDASWLDAEGVRLAHPALPNSVAEALGARSLRCAAVYVLLKSFE